MDEAMGEILQRRRKESEDLREDDGTYKTKHGEVERCRRMKEGESGAKYFDVHSLTW